MYMPAMDDRVGTCGAWPYADRPCNEPGVVRAVIETDASDRMWEPERGPSVGDEVMVVLCQKHKDGVIAEVEAARKAAAEREAKRAEAAREVAEAEAALEQARAKFDRI